MEKKIDISEILKYYPKGTKLYSPLCGECEFHRVYCRNEEICIEIKTNEEVFACNKYGYYFYGINREVIIFPSKENRDWNKFQRPFKDGDIVTCTNEYCTYIAIFKKMKDDNSFYRHAVTYNNEFCCESNDWSDFNETCRFATEEEKQKLFDAIKANGHKWNAETKTLEKLIVPKFKMGERIKKKDSNEDVVLITDIADNYYYIVETKYGMEVTISINLQDNYELVPNKFDISTLKPFDKVLVRSVNTDKWKISFFGYISNENKRYFMCVNSSGFYQCIPYNDDTKHLLGTTDDCDEFYKTW